MEERIDDYIDGKMSEAEKAAFERLMESDKDLAAMVDNYTSMEDVADGALEMELLNEVEGVGNASVIPKAVLIRRPKQNRRLNLIIAALLAVVALLITYLNSGDSTLERNEQLWADLYERPEVPSTVRSAKPENLKTTYDEAMYYFSINDWKKSEAAWNTVLESTNAIDTVSTANFFLGHIKLNAFEVAAAKRYFIKSEKVIHANNRKLMESLK